MDLELVTGFELHFCEFGQHELKQAQNLERMFNCRFIWPNGSISNWPSRYEVHYLPKSAWKP